MEQNRTWNICYLKKFLKMDHKYSVSIALCMSGIPTKSFESHVLWRALYKSIHEYWVYLFWSATSHSPVRVMCLRCYLADMERRGVLLTRSLLSWPRWRGGGEYLLNMPRPVWQPSHYIRPVISLKLLHSKWLSRVRVICLSTGELEGGWGDLDLLLFVSQLNLRLLMMILRENKGKIFSSGENYFSNVGITSIFSWPRGAPHLKFSEKVRSLSQSAGLMGC